MRIVAAAHSLAGAGGSETYLVTVADHLQRLGHDVWLHSAETGRSTDVARRLGVRVTSDEAELPTDPDVLLVQDAAVACELAARYAAVPQLFVAHSDIFDLQLPPQLPGLVAAVVTLYDRVDRRVRALAEPVERIVRLSQPVDLERFKPSRPLRARPRALAIGNYVHGQRLALLSRACARAGVELRHVGLHGEGEQPAEAILNDADIVFGKARVVVEALACGRAAYVFDHNGGDGWVTAETYGLLAADNFGGQSLPDTIDEERLVADLARYEPGMGVVNRDLAVLHHSAGKHAAALVDVLRAVAGSTRGTRPDAPLRELGRLVRLYHRADAQAFLLRAETEGLAARAFAAEQRAAELERELRARDERLRELDGELRARDERLGGLAGELHARDERLRAGDRELRERDERLRALDGELRASAERLRSFDGELHARDARLGPLEHEAAELRAALTAARAETAEQADQAARLAALLHEVTATRRWRTLQAVLGPADRLRHRAATRPARRPLAPPPRDPVAPARPPVPFVVGVPRSGTTLLRLQLDSHPQLAIGPETGFGLVTVGLDEHAGPDELLDALSGCATWGDLAIDRDEARSILERAEPWSIGGGLYELYAELAARHGKPRWGDKTPLHITCMPHLARLVGEAHFIHIIRDGRDVAASVRHLPFAPGDGSIEAIARDWRDLIAGARAAAPDLDHYREIRYERLVAAPEEVLRELCAFVELDFDPAMLRAHERAGEVMARLPERRRRTDGSTVTRAERMARHVHLAHPPDPSRAGRWRDALTAEEVARFEEHAGEMLAELGYA